ncbi:hypothetical protein EMCRGX_G021820 [Ephydatia muelleri]
MRSVPPVKREGGRFHGRSIFKTLRCYMSLNHLAQAARAVLQNPSQISQMLADLNRVDFANVQHKVADAMGKTTIDIMTEHSRAILRADSFDNGQVGKSDGVVV